MVAGIPEGEYLPRTRVEQPYYPAEVACGNDRLPAYLRIGSDSSSRLAHSPPRHVRNKRLYDALDQWAFCTLTRSPGARGYYDQHRAADDTHHQALRALGNRLVGIFHECLRHHLQRTHSRAHRQAASA